MKNADMIQLNFETPLVEVVKIQSYNIDFLMGLKKVIFRKQMGIILQRRHGSKNQNAFLICDLHRRAGTQVKNACLVFDF